MGFEILRRVAISGMALLCSGSMALSAGLDIAGNYGNAEGCAFGKDTGNFSGGGYMLLTPEEWKTPETACDFTDVSAPWEKYGNRIFTVTAVCAGEGTDVSRTELMRIEKSTEEADTYVVYDADGMEVGRGKRCQ